MLVAPPAATIASAGSAFAASPDAMWRRTLVSRKPAGIRLVPIELEIGRTTIAESAKTLQEFAASRLARDAKLLGTREVDFDFVACLSLGS
jgi:hypothetical protein